MTTANSHDPAAAPDIPGGTEVVRVVFDPFKRILAWLWELHDRIQLNRQENDVGTRYRPVISYENKNQWQEADERDARRAGCNKESGQRLSGSVENVGFA